MIHASDEARASCDRRSRPYRDTTVYRKYSKSLLEHGHYMSTGLHNHAMHRATCVYVYLSVCECVPHFINLFLVFILYIRVIRVYAIASQSCAATACMHHHHRRRHHLLLLPLLLIYYTVPSPVHTMLDFIRLFINQFRRLSVRMYRSSLTSSPHVTTSRL